MANLPPGVEFRLAQLASATTGGDRDAVHQLAALVGEDAEWLAREPKLLELAERLCAHDTPQIQVIGCRLFGLFPVAESIERLTAIARDGQRAPDVRDASYRALAARDLRTRHDVVWPPSVVQFADDTLWQIADAVTRDSRLPSAGLVDALRSVTHDSIAAVFARAPGRWGAALEVFATAPLARVLYVALDDIPPIHRIRALRLIANALGDEALPLLRSRVGVSRGTERIEVLQLAVAIGGEGELGALEDGLRGATSHEIDSEAERRRARWQLAHPKEFVFVRGVRIARTAALIPLETRANTLGQAVNDLAAAASWGAIDVDGALASRWASLVRALGDPALTRSLIEAAPFACREVAELYLIDLARRGRIARVWEVAGTLGREDLGALQLAIWGRPLAALELAAHSTTHSPELVCARALACYRAGRPDLALRVLDDDLPSVRPVAGDHSFPGPHERWLADHAADRAPAMAALVRGRDAVFELAQPAPLDGEPDLASVAPLATLARRLADDIANQPVYVDRELVDRAAVVAAVERAGGVAVSGVLAGTTRFAGKLAPAVHASLIASGLRHWRPDLQGGG